MNRLKKTKHFLGSVDLLVNFPSVSFVDEVALAGGDVPLADGGVGRARVHVDVVQGGARDVLSVAPGLKKNNKYSNH